MLGRAVKRDPNRLIVRQRRSHIFMHFCPKFCTKRFDDTLGFEIDRLHRSCRRLIWLNPLLRYEGFEPKSLGMRAMLPHVDEFRPVHNLESLENLASVLSAPAPRRLMAATLLQTGTRAA